MKHAYAERVEWQNNPVGRFADAVPSSCDSTPQGAVLIGQHRAEFHFLFEGRFTCVAATIASTLQGWAHWIQQDVHDAECSSTFDRQTFVVR
jgi:hypothetical protein